jgi:hypothetical protein
LEAFSAEVMDEDDEIYIDKSSKQLKITEVDNLIVPKKEMQVQRQIIESPTVKPAGIYKVSYSPEPAKFWVSESVNGQEHSHT